MSRAWGLLALASLAFAQDTARRPESLPHGYEAWLRYAPLDRAARAEYAHLPAVVYAPGSGPVIEAARDELV